MDTTCKSDIYPALNGANEVKDDLFFGSYLEACFKSD